MRAMIYNNVLDICPFDGMVTRIVSCCTGKAHFEVSSCDTPADDDPKSVTRGPFMAITDEVKNIRPCDGSCQQIEVYLPAEVEAAIAKLDCGDAKNVTIQSGWVRWDKIPQPRTS